MLRWRRLAGLLDVRLDIDQIHLTAVISSRCLLENVMNGIVKFPDKAFWRRNITFVCASDRPSVRLSVTFVSCAKTSKRIFKFFSPSGSQAILVLPYQTAWQYSNGNPPNGGVECRGYEKIAIFDQYLTLCRKWYKIRPYLLCNANSKSNAIYWIVQIPMTLSDREWPSEILNDMKHSAASLRQLSFLSIIHVSLAIIKSLHYHKGLVYCSWMSNDNDVSLTKIKHVRYSTCRSEHLHTL